MNSGLCIVDNVATTHVEEVTVQWGKFSVDAFAFNKILFNGQEDNHKINDRVFWVP